jgi:hypothetical protein
MCAAAGLVDLRFSTRSPYWCDVGAKGEGVNAGQRFSRTGQYCRTMA